jgi:hypothetical protein
VKLFVDNGSAFPLTWSSFPTVVAACIAILWSLFLPLSL